MSTPFGVQPTYDELVKLVNDLHDKVNAPLTIDDLPLRDLRSKLIDNGEPLDLSVLGLTGQIADWGTAQPKIRTGAGVMPFGAAGTAAVATVNHGLDSAPNRFLALYTGYAGAVGLFIYEQSVTSTQITWRGVATAAPGADQSFTWLAALV
jgi:hypothetical protein